MLLTPVHHIIIIELLFQGLAASVWCCCSSCWLLPCDLQQTCKAADLTSNSSKTSWTERNSQCWCHTSQYKPHTKHWYRCVCCTNNFLESALPIIIKYYFYIEVLRTETVCYWLVHVPSNETGTQVLQTTALGWWQNCHWKKSLTVAREKGPQCHNLILEDPKSYPTTLHVVFCFSLQGIV